MTLTLQRQIKQIYAEGKGQVDVFTNGEHPLQQWVLSEPQQPTLAIQTPSHIGPIWTVHTGQNGQAVPDSRFLCQQESFVKLNWKLRTGEITHSEGCKVVKLLKRCFTWLQVAKAMSKNNYSYSKRHQKWYSKALLQDKTHSSNRWTHSPLLNKEGCWNWQPRRGNHNACVQKFSIPEASFILLTDLLCKLGCFLIV